MNDTVTITKTQLELIRRQLTQSLHLIREAERMIQDAKLNEIKEQV